MFLAGNSGAAIHPEEEPWRQKGLQHRLLTVWDCWSLRGTGCGRGQGTDSQVCGSAGRCGLQWRLPRVPRVGSVDTCMQVVALSLHGSPSLLWGTPPGLSQRGAGPRTRRSRWAPRRAASTSQPMRWTGLGTVGMVSGCSPWLPLFLQDVRAKGWRPQLWLPVFAGPSSLGDLRQ